MKKIVSLILILLIVMCLTITNNVYAASCKVDLSLSKTEFNKGDQFTVSVKLSDIKDVAEFGIISTSGTINYDSNNLSIVEVKAAGDWSGLIFNKDNGKYTMERNMGSDGKFATGNETILNITFKVKDSSSASADITLKDVQFSDSDVDIDLQAVSTTIKVTGGSSNPGTDNPNPDDTQKPNTNPGNDNQNPGVTPDDNQDVNSGTNNNGNQNSNSGNTTTNNNQNKNTTSQITNLNSYQSNTANTKVKDSKLPYAGETTAILLIITGVVVISLVFYIKIKIIDRNSKK